MIWVIVVVIGLLCFGINTVYELTDTKLGMILNCLWAVPLTGVLSVLVGVALSMLTGIIAMPFMPTEEVILSETQICSVTDSSEYEGHFVLGSGYFDSDLKIYYVTETDAGRKIHSISGGRTTIIETDTEQPKALVTGQRYKYRWLNIFFFDINEMSGSQDVTLIVPKDTVTLQYSIDLK